MSDTKKKKVERITTPKGVAVFPKLNKPETHVNGQELETPRFVTELEFNEADAGVAEFKAKIEDLHEQAVAVAEAARKKDPKRNKKPLVVNPVCRPVVVDGEEVPGKFRIIAKTSAVYNDGEPKVIRMFDAAGKPITKKINVGGGSILRLSVTPSPYDTNLGAGLSLYLDAVKVIELHNYSGGNAESYGFGEAEEGFSADADAEGMESDESANAGADADQGEQAPKQERRKGDF